eukprot:scaffold38621_cov81-Phaeocystis_antarctica.AAC.7
MNVVNVEGSTRTNGLGSCSAQQLKPLDPFRIRKRNCLQGGADALRLGVDRDLHLRAGVLLARIGVHLQQLGQVKLRLLEHLDLADEDVLQRVDATARLLDLLADGLRDELVDELLERARLRLPGHDVGHLLTDGLDLRVVGVASLLELVHPLLGEADAEEPQHVAVGRLHVDVRLDQRLPLAHHRPQLVGGELHTVELRQAVVALHLLALQLELAVRLVLVLVQVGQVELEHAALQHLRGNLCEGERGGREKIVLGAFQTGAEL